ncbi:hypothetical protein ON010_g3369 [Phytophthora cinnamomi]|nr:hypothetical protein ON010_g3369 [Phytophthora cinnamomi]
MQRRHERRSEDGRSHLIFGRQWLGHENLCKRPEEVARRKAHAGYLVVAVYTKASVQQQLQRLDVAQVGGHVHGVLLGSAEELAHESGVAVHFFGEVGAQALLGVLEQTLQLGHVPERRLLVQVLAQVVDDARALRLVPAPASLQPRPDSSGLVRLLERAQLHAQVLAEAREVREYHEVGEEGDDREHDVQDGPGAAAVEVVALEDGVREVEDDHEAEHEHDDAQQLAELEEHGALDLLAAAAVAPPPERLEDAQPRGRQPDEHEQRRHVVHQHGVHHDGVAGAAVVGAGHGQSQGQGLRVELLSYSDTTHPHHIELYVTA